jgi:hypothetical protein
LPAATASRKLRLLKDKAEIALTLSELTNEPGIVSWEYSILQLFPFCIFLDASRGNLTLISCNNLGFFLDLV